MGCTYSDLPSDGGDGLTFRVYNVDGQGNKLNPGKIKVAASHLVLYQKGKEAIRWPLRCLRRYGFDAELFSFECGRRCQTGPGIYAFWCRQAEDLFVLVQESIQRAGQEDQLRALSNGGGSGSSGGSHAMFAPHPAAASTTTPHNLAFSQGFNATAATAGSSPGSTLGRNTAATSRPSSYGEGHHYINGAVPVSCSASDGAQYINTGPISGAFPIEESSPLIDFMNHSGFGGGGGGVGAGGRSQVNYAVILPSSMENLLDEEGQDAVSNFPPPPPPPYCPKHEGGGGGVRLPPDFLPPSMDSLGGLLGPDDVLFQDCDVFLPEDAAADEQGGGAFRNYINIGASEPSPPPLPVIYCQKEAAATTTTTTTAGHAAAESGGGGDKGRGGSGKKGGGLAVDPAASFMPNYANLLIHNNTSASGGGGGGAGSSQACGSSSGCGGGGGGLKPKQQQQQHTSHYLELDLNPAPSSDCTTGGAGAGGGGGAGAGGGGAVGGAAGGVPSQSPTSPISSASVPESSSSYAKIDFNKTEALSHSSRAGTNGEDEPGARKTRHNSTIGM